MLSIMSYSVRSTSMMSSQLQRDSVSELYDVSLMALEVI